MSDILFKIQNLIARAASDNENEARTSAFLAVKLIREHRIELCLPGQRVAEPVTVVVEVPVTPVTNRRGRDKSPSVRDIYGSLWAFRAEGARGHCLFCALPLVYGSSAYVSDEGALHLACWPIRQSGKNKPGPAPKPNVAHRSVPEPSAEDEQRALDSIWEVLKGKP